MRFLSVHLSIPKLVLALAVIVVAGAAAAEPWTTFHGDQRNSGHSNADAPFDSLLAWSYAGLDPIIMSSPVVGADGTIYVGTLGKDLMALSPYGDILWSFHGGGNFRLSTPALAADGTIYIGGSDGVLHAINPDGSRKWTYEIQAAIKTSPNIGPSGVVYFGADDGNLYAVNPDSTLGWSYATGDTIRSSPAIGPDGTIFFGSMDSYFYALRPNGLLRWRAATGGIIKYCSPAVSETGIVYFGSYDGFVYAIGSDQTFHWAYQTGHAVRSSPALGLNGEVYIGSGTQVISIDPLGSLDWEFDTGGLVYSSPVYFADDSVLCVGSDSGAFYCLKDDGSFDWQYTVGSPIRTTPAPGWEGTVIAGDMSGIIWSFGDLGANTVPDNSDFGVRHSLNVSPNPFRSTVTFRAAAGDAAGGTLKIFDIRGREVAAIESGSAQSYLWDGRAKGGQALPSGVYLYRLSRPERVGRVVLLR